MLKLRLVPLSSFPLKKSTLRPAVLSVGEDGPVSRRSSRQFLHEVQHYAHLSVRLSERYDSAVHAAEVRVAGAPDLWPKYKHKTRRILDRKFKFSLVYLYTESEVVVIAVAPFRRKPGYWKARLSDGWCL